MNGVASSAFADEATKRASFGILPWGLGDSIIYSFWGDGYGIFINVTQLCRLGYLGLNLTMMLILSIYAYDLSAVHQCQL